MYAQIGCWFDCEMIFCIRTKVGSSPCRIYLYWALAHPVVGPPFRYRTCTGRRRSLEVGIMKRAGLCLDSCFMYILEQTSFNICFKSDVITLGSIEMYGFGNCIDEYG